MAAVVLASRPAPIAVANRNGMDELRDAAGEEQTEGRKDINNGISCRAQRPIGQMRNGGRARDAAWAGGRASEGSGLTDSR